MPLLAMSGAEPWIGSNMDGYWFVVGTHIVGCRLRFAFAHRHGDIRPSREARHRVVGSSRGSDLWA
jgi:hypothetical protein